MSATHQMQGARLEYVCRAIKGEVVQTTVKWDAKAKKLVRVPVRRKDCYMVYLPTGHSYRLTAAEVVKQGFDRQPNILNFERINDTKSAAGQFKHAVNQETKEAAWRKLEDEVIKLCIRKHGKAERSMEEVEENDTAEA